MRPSSCLASMAGLASTAASSAIQPISSRADRACNNSPQLCDKAYDQITFMGAHNSPFVRDDSNDNSVSGNQFKNATEALSAGLRLLQGQVHLENNALQLCHTSCSLFDGGSLQSWLGDINSWMKDNPNEVVTILLVNSDDVDASSFETAYSNSGLSKLAYTDTQPGGEWPTLGSMIDKGTRLVSFVTNIGDSSGSLLYEFDYVFETPFEVVSPNGFNCTVDRPSRAGDDGASAITNGWLGLVNHFQDETVLGSYMIPDVDAIDTTNDPGTSTAGNLGKHLQECKDQWSSKPNFVLVDFWSKGDPVAAADSLNGVSSARGRSKVSAEEGAAAGGIERNLGRGALLAFLAGALLLA